MYKKLWAVLVVVILVMSLIPAVSAQEEELIAFRKLSTKEIRNEFTSEVTTHIYTISASAEDKVTIRMTQDEGSTLDPYLVLLGSRGEVIAANDDGGEVNLSALIMDAEIPADGLYFVVASSFEFVDDILDFEIPVGESLIYTISATGFNEPADSSLSNQYFTGALQDGARLEGKSSPQEPVYYYTYIGEAGQTLEITLNSADFDTLLYLITPEGERIAVNDDDPANSGTNSAIRGITLPVSGKYLIFATDVFFYNPENFTGGEFTISLTVN